MMCMFDEMIKRITSNNFEKVDCIHFYWHGKKILWINNTFC